MYEQNLHDKKEERTINLAILNSNLGILYDTKVSEEFSYSIRNDAEYTLARGDQFIRLHKSDLLQLKDVELQKKLGIYLTEEQEQQIQKMKNSLDSLNRSAKQKYTEQKHSQCFYSELKAIAYQLSGGTNNYWIITSKLPVNYLLSQKEAEIKKSLDAESAFLGIASLSI